MRRCDQISPAPQSVTLPPLSTVSPPGNCALLVNCQHGGNCGEEMSQSSVFCHQEALSPGVHHPVLLPPEGKTPRLFTPEEAVINCAGYCCYCDVTYQHLCNNVTGDTVMMAEETR